MNIEIIQTLTSTFEASAQQAEDGVEYWQARDLSNVHPCRANGAPTHQPRATP